MVSATARVVFICIAALALGSADALAQTSNPSYPRIYGGANSSATKSIGFLIQADRTHNYVSVCSGTFISATHFLTAKHCTANNGFNNPYFFIFNSNSGSSLRVLAKASSKTDDLAILTVRPSNVIPMPILLSHSPTAGDVVQIFGYGKDQYQKAAFEQGSKHFLKFGVVTLTNASRSILSFINSVNGGACHGDSGGPMISLNQHGQPGIIAVASYGIVTSNRCTSGTKSSYVNLQSASALSFINAYAPEVLIN
jgi:secreted trypsin-like serine protease